MVQIEVMTVSGFRRDLSNVLRHVHAVGRPIGVGPLRQPLVAVIPWADVLQRGVITRPVDPLARSQQLAWEAGLPLIADSIGYAMACGYLETSSASLSVPAEVRPVLQHLWSTHQARNSAPLRSAARIMWRTLLATCEDLRSPNMTEFAQVVADHMTSRDHGEAERFIVAAISSTE